MQHWPIVRFNNSGVKLPVVVTSLPVKLGRWFFRHSAYIFKYKCKPGEGGLTNNWNSFRESLVKSDGEVNYVVVMSVASLCDDSRCSVVAGLDGSLCRRSCLSTGTTSYWALLQPANQIVVIAARVTFLNSFSCAWYESCKRIKYLCVIVIVYCDLLFVFFVILYIFLTFA